jgi:hypothetical protein
MTTELLTTPEDKRNPQTTVVMTINVPAADAFNYIAPIYF